jgi:hypothetical protein
MKSKYIATHQFLFRIILVYCCDFFVDLESKRKFTPIETKATTTPTTTTSKNNNKKT